MKADLFMNMGTDLDVCRIAKGCYGKDTNKVDTRLLKHLATSGHWNPFGHCTATFKCKAPLFVWRQITRSRRGLTESPDDLWPIDVTNITETSRRYAKKKELEFHVSDRLSEEDQAFTRMMTGALEQDVTRLVERGVPFELARTLLPQTLMTDWFWTGTMAAWGRVAMLRLDSHAQAETREFAKLISDHCRELWPESWRVLVDDNL